MEPIIQVKCLKHVYPDRTQVDLCGNDFIVYPGERVAVLGANGSGKTTLLLHILGLLTPLEGFVDVLGMDPIKQFNQVRTKIGVLLQNTDEQIIGPRVYDDIAFTLQNQKLPSDEIHTRVLQIAQTLGIDDILDKIPHYLSGGQKKKVALAGALVTLPEILILDEPFDNLDPKSKKDIKQLLNHMNQKHHIALIITTHDVNHVKDIADKVVVIDKGKTSISGTPEEVFSQTHALLAAHLEPPILPWLFQKLQDRGVVIPTPYTLEEAETFLMEFIDQQKERKNPHD